MSARMDHIKEFMMCMIDTGSGRNIVIDSCCNEEHIFYDYRLKEQFPDLTKAEVEKAIKIAKKEDLVRESEHNHLTLNLKKWGNRK